MAKRKGKGRGKTNTYTKYLLLLALASMVLSSLYYGLSRGMDEPTAEEEGADPVGFVSYDSARAGAQSVLAEITKEQDAYKLVPRSMSSIDREDVEAVVGAEFEGVEYAVLELSPGYSMFHVAVNDSSALDNIRERVRLPGGYDTYRVYSASTSAGEIDVIGEGLAVGDSVAVLLLQRTRQGRSELLGFSQGKVASGDAVPARVLGFQYYNVAGLVDEEISEDEVAAAVGVEEVRVGQPLGNASLTYEVNVEAPLNTDTCYVADRLEGLGAYNVSVRKVGYASVPEYVVSDGKLAKVPGYESITASFREDAEVNDTVDVRVYSMGVGEHQIAFATQT